MKKNVYSLVLSEDVIAAVDRLAYQHSTNRSNMINQILAEYVSYVTPEKRMQQILQQVEALLNGQDTFQVMVANSSDSMLSLRSALAYKYNPTVRYSVELYRSNTANTADTANPAAVGALKVSLRTQNANLILTMQQFYELWIRLEQHYLGQSGPGGRRSYTVEGGRMTRELRPALATGAANGNIRSNAAAMTEQALGQAIARYVQTLDQCMKVYFYNLDNPNGAIREIENRYATYLQSGERI